MGYAERLDYEQHDRMSSRLASDAAFDETHRYLMTCDAQGIADCVMRSAEFALADALIAAVRDLDRANPDQLPEPIRLAWAKLHDAICNEASERAK